jgi:hypothetical protein
VNEKILHSAFITFGEIVDLVVPLDPATRNWIDSHFFNWMKNCFLFSLSHSLCFDKQFSLSLSLLNLISLTIYIYNYIKHTKNTHTQ